MYNNNNTNEQLDSPTEDQYWVAQDSLPLTFFALCYTQSPPTTAVCSTTVHVMVSMTESLSVTVYVYHSAKCQCCITLYRALLCHAYICDCVQTYVHLHTIHSANCNTHH